jgi:hypothetical protein
MAALCLAALAPITAGALPSRSDFREAPCGDGASPALRYDAARRSLAAMRDIAAGEVVAAPPPSLLPDVAEGAPLTLVARVGTAIVEREVAAAQPGRTGRRIFVRTGDGQLIAAPLVEDAR